MIIVATPPPPPPPLPQGCIYQIPTWYRSYKCVGEVEFNQYIAQEQHDQNMFGMAMAIPFFWIGLTIMFFVVLGWITGKTYIETSKWMSVVNRKDTFDRNYQDILSKSLLLSTINTVWNTLPPISEKKRKERKSIKNGTTKTRLK